jgi:hypothetical protein
MDSAENTSALGPSALVKICSAPCTCSPTAPWRKILFEVFVSHTLLDLADIINKELVLERS